MLGEKLAAVCVEQASTGFVSWLEEKGVEIVPVTLAAALKLGVNGVCLGGDRVLSTAESSELNERLRALGLTVYDPELSAFTLGGRRRALPDAGHPARARRLMPVDPRRVIADLRELDRLTGGPGGARRVCWTPEWEAARDFLTGRLSAIDGVTVERDEAANLWARLPGEREGSVAVGSHIDSVPGGGWLDGALGVMAALEVLRVAAEERPAHGVTLVDFADEEGARFGHSLFGSSAVAGTLDPASLDGLTDAGGVDIAAALAEHGVDLGSIAGAVRRREGLRAYLELHIEQGPVLDREGVSVAAVSGTAGVERHRFGFRGQAAHAGTTPMEMRRDAGLAASATALAVEGIARAHGGVGTTGRAAAGARHTHGRGRRRRDRGGPAPSR